MTVLYHDSDLWEAVMQRRKLLAVFLSVTAAFLAGEIALIVYYAGLPYQDPNGTWTIAVACVIVSLYIIFCFPFMGISYKRSNAYCKMLGFISAGLRESDTAPFVGIENWLVRDGVDVNVATFEAKNIKREETMVRQIYVDGEKDFPPFEEGRFYRLVLQGNLLLAYAATDRVKTAEPPAAGIRQE